MAIRSSTARRVTGSISAVLLAGALFAEVESAQAQEVIIAPMAPPPVRVEPPPPPRANFVWEAGHWQWMHGRYVWRRGHWQPMRRGGVWHAGHWQPAGPRWQWVPGHW